MTRFIIITIVALAVDAVVSQNARAADAAAGSVEVDMVGTVKTHVIAPGGETTGVTIAALGFNWELDFQGNKEFALVAEKLDGKEANVKGTLTIKEGVEVKRRVIILVKDIRPLAK